MRRAQQERSIWHWPIRVGLVLAGLPALHVMFLVPDVPGRSLGAAFSVRLGAIVYEGIRAHIVGFFATVIHLTYVRVAKP